MKRLEGEAFNRLEREIAQLHQANVVAGQLKSGSTIRSSAGIFEKIQRQLAADLLRDVETFRHSKGHKARLEEVRVCIVRFSLGALDYFRLEIVDDQPSVVRAARGLLATSTQRATAMVEEYKHGFSVEGVVASPDPHSGATAAWYERWSKANPGLEKLLIFLAGVLSAWMLKLLFA